MIRNFCLILGLFILILAWAGPLPRAAGNSFAAHMTLHMLIVAMAAPLLAIGIARTQWDPVARVPALFPPVIASAVEMIIVWAWHAPALHHFARGSLMGFTIEQSTFLISGLWLWLSALGGVAEGNASPPAMQTRSTITDHPRRGHIDNQVDKQRQAAGVLALLLTSMHMTLLGALLAFAPRLLFEHHAAHHGSSDQQMFTKKQHGEANDVGPSPIAAQVIEGEQMFQQQLGGVIMLVVGGAAYLAGGVALTAKLLPTYRAADEEASSA